MASSALVTGSSTSSSCSDGKYFIGGNWKCNGSRASVESLVSTLNGGGAWPANVDVVVAPPALHVGTVQATLRSDTSVAVQNIWKAPKNGAFTGELTATMVKDFGIDWVVVGHSERRGLYHETNELAAEKAQIALKQGLNVIFCCGETLKDREEANTERVVLAQLRPLLTNMAAAQWGHLVVAYEPVWAIGTGKVATPEQAQEVHRRIRAFVASCATPAVARSLRIIYGGSVKAKNCTSLIAQPDIDGFLVGGASLQAQFIDIIKCVPAGPPSKRRRPGSRL